MTPKNMIFTSAGDIANFIKFWCCDKEQTYDIYVYYYGDNEDIYRLYESKVKYINKSKGSKFQNFYKFWNTYPEIIKEYDRFFILDDDIEISCEDINKMFNISREYNLEICGPSFKSESKISHRITLHKLNTILSYTNFVEVNVPLFSKNALENLMKVYDPILIGWGIDFLYIWANGIDKTSSYAIIHKIQCVNPLVDLNNRKISKLSSFNEREDIWKNYSNTINCPERIELKEYSAIDINGDIYFYIKCSTKDCIYLIHTDKTNNGGAHCCWTCKNHVGHGPLCERLK